MQLEKLKGKNEKSVKKMGFLVLAKHGLNKHEIRPKSGLILRERTVERERREGEKRRRRRRRREEEEEKREKQAKNKKVWNYMGFKALDGFSMQLYSY